MVHAKQLRVQYPIALPGFKGWFRKGHFTALEGADFSIAEGTTLGVMGESGSGKTSLAQAVLGLLEFQGELTFSEESWQGSPEKDLPLRRRVQVVFRIRLAVCRQGARWVKLFLKDCGCITQTSAVKRLNHGFGPP